MRPGFRVDSEYDDLQIVGNAIHLVDTRNEAMHHENGVHRAKSNLTHDRIYRKHILRPSNN